jgi:hypothetical protein
VNVPSINVPPAKVPPLSALPAKVPPVNVPPLVALPVTVPSVNMPSANVPPVTVPSANVPLQPPAVDPLTEARAAARATPSLGAPNSPPAAAVIQVATLALDPAPPGLSFERPTGNTASSPANRPMANGPIANSQVMDSAPLVTVPPLAPLGVSSNPPADNPAAIAPLPVRPEPVAVQPAVPPIPTIEFGQPLPQSFSPQSFSPQSFSPQSPSSLNTVQSSTVLMSASTNPGDVVLPAGTLLNLRYPGTDALNLRSTPAQQDVLLLQTEVRDSLGRVLLPLDTMVIGRFDTQRAGSRFIAQAIAMPGRNVPLRAESELLTGDRTLKSSNLAINSGIGAVAGGVLGGGSGAGAAGGAVAGAALTYFTAPKIANIAPGQMIQVRLLEDFR